MKKRKHKKAVPAKRTPYLIIGVLIVLGLSFLAVYPKTLAIFGSSRLTSLQIPEKNLENVELTFEKTTLTPTPTKKPSKPIIQVAGPCTRLPVLMYHHIEELKEASKEGHLWLAVAPDQFDKQMQYLKDKGYTSVPLQAVSDFFDANKPLPPKPVAITFDDGYKDIYTNAFPVLQRLGFKATVFTITGLVGQKDYLSWDDISQMRSNFDFANHTWSHRSMLSNSRAISSEIQTADQQLSERGLNQTKVFAYPSGGVSSEAVGQLRNLNYKLAFTTVSGTNMCKGGRFELPRVRVGNTILSYYGL